MLVTILYQLVYKTLKATYIQPESTYIHVCTLIVIDMAIVWGGVRRSIHFD